MSVGPDPAQDVQDATEGAGRYAESGNTGEGRSDELRAELVELVRAPYSWSWSLPTTPHAEKIADAILAAGYTQGSDIHLVAYASLHETVRRFLAGEANRSYLTKRFEDIEDDLQRAVVARRADQGV